MNWPTGSSEMARRVREHDWAATSMGPIDRWPVPLKAMVDVMLAARQPVYIGWGDEVLSLYNDSYLPILGDKHPHALGLPFAAVWPEKDQRVMLAAVMAGESHLLVDQPFALTGRPGRPMSWFTFSWTPVRLEDGSIGGFISFATETTEEVLSRRSLEESEERLRLATEVTDLGIFDWNLASGDVEANDRFRALFQQPAEGTLRADRILEGIVHPDDLAQVRQLIADACDPAGPGRYAFEHRIRTPAGERWILTSAQVRFDTVDGERRAVRIVGNDLDITERKHAEDAVRESEHRLQTLVEGIPQLVWRAVDGGEWTWCSPQWSEYTGQTQADCVGHGWLEALHPDDREGALRFWSEAVRAGELEMDGRLRNASDGTYHWFQTRATPVRDRRGRIVEWLGTSTDIDDLRRLQQRQESLLAELQHRVRNILTVVRSVLNRTAERSIDVDDLLDHFRGRLDALARTQVVVAQSVAGTVDLENLIRDELLSVGVSDGPGSGVTLSGPDVELPVDAVASIGLAIHELTTNALKYGALKTPSATLDIRWFVNMDGRGSRVLNLTWTEKGVPVVPVPPREGFGRELIEHALPYRLGAVTDFAFRGGGVCCDIRVPLPAEGQVPDALMGRLL
ncbi:PAS domain-containing sensor histidine kinase [Sphingomonas corticis]|uniref:histidine kinase n=1 Tax=Sphingomonas corticis TaxID=2722791 RepID=A0ABX1CNS6_9SPHN|nr:PAS domain-containing protein [Sphingomonas corticis]NJR78901.1 PAS domain-containing protein [Sphingomonas corticis]